MGIENPVHLLFIAVVALVVLGPKRLPELARALGQGIREFRQAVSWRAGRHQRTSHRSLVAAPRSIRPSLYGRAMRLIVARCEVSYIGRTDHRRCPRPCGC